MQLTYQVAKSIGVKMKAELGEKKKAWLSTSADLTPFTTAPVESVTVQSAVENYTSGLKDVKCAGQASVQAAFDAGLLAGILGLQAVLSTAGNVAGMFQPSLLAATKLTAQDTQAITAGFLDGLDKYKQFIVVRPPALKATNKVTRRPLPLSRRRRTTSVRSRKATGPSRACWTSPRAARSSRMTASSTRSY